MGEQEFSARIKEAVEAFNGFDPAKPTRLISHLDADGICSAALVLKLLRLRKTQHSVTIVPGLTTQVLEELAEENHTQYIISDLGSGVITQIASILKNKKVIVLDHHTVESHDQFANVVHVNPHLFDIDGGEGISGAGVCFRFITEAEKSLEKFAHLAIVGATGDIQDKQGFIGPNKEILETGVKHGVIKEKQCIRFFGIHSRPLYKILQYSSDPHIPGVTNSESAAVQFLYSVGIDPKRGSEWRMYTDLTHDQIKKLALGIIMKRKDKEKPDDIFGTMYELPQDEMKQLCNAKEFATLLNSCGRMGKASLGIGVCLNDPVAKKKAMLALNSYKRQIVVGMNWYNDYLKSGNVIRGDNYMILNAEDQVMPTLIGTISTMIAKGGEIKDNMFLLSLARNDDDTTKISLRLSGENPNNLDLRDIITKIASKVGGESGGHMNAAGAVIPTDKEADFIDTAKQILKQAGLEEVVS